jgi:curli biogenesis system outer membrane secretion channel CsgG
VTILMRREGELPRWAALGLAASLCGLTGCGGGETPSPPVPAMATLCETPVHANVGVAPFENETEANVQLAGTDDLLSTAMVESGCFTMIEREALQLLLEELRLCSETNPDKELFDCAKPAEGEEQAGGLKLVNTLVLGKLLFFEPEVEGAKLKLQLPAVGGISAGTTYTALTMNVRAVDVKSRQLVAQMDLHTVLSSQEAGIEVEQSGFALGASGFQRSKLGVEFTKMMQQGASQLHERMEAAP